MEALSQWERTFSAQIVAIRFPRWLRRASTDQKLMGSHRVRRSSARLVTGCSALKVPGADTNENIWTYVLTCVRFAVNDSRGKTTTRIMYIDIDCKNSAKARKLYIK